MSYFFGKKIHTGLPRVEKFGLETAQEYKIREVLDPEFIFQENETCLAHDSTGRGPYFHHPQLHVVGWSVKVQKKKNYIVSRRITFG